MRLESRSPKSPDFGTSLKEMILINSSKTGNSTQQRKKQHDFCC
ncbi:hypothetical protein SRABI04_01780 [Chryseobacterium sp. Bi04]|nr:hypothetical protein SRABI04_01780 [Chryseobacterium sp. Bi04]